MDESPLGDADIPLPDISCGQQISIFLVDQDKIPIHPTFHRKLPSKNGFWTARRD
jgi:hypothetical protein